MDDNVDEAMRGPDISEAEHEVVLTEERPVVQKETVPVERVRLTKDTVTDEAQVTEEVAKEQIETEGVEDRADKTRRGDMRGRP
jgi:stress response protein YsnF